jgi:predicted TIM-barrel fold metal-dependent hydrolase
MTAAADVRRHVDHPIIDADGHFVELGPMLDEECLTYLEEAGGPGLRDRYLNGTVRPYDTSTVLADRERPDVKAEWRGMPSWWGWPTKNVRDRATSHLPRMLYERLDEIGVDFMLVYPSTTLALTDIQDDELAGALAHAANRYLAAAFAPYRDRMAVGGIVPMNTPAVAIAAAEHAVNELGLKTLLIGSYARRPLGPKPASGPQAFRLDTFGIDSAYDYDPFWARCVSLGVAPLSHGQHQHIRVSRSSSNYIYDHIGSFSVAHEALAKSLFLGGVTRRFPTLNFGFLEGGIGWAASLYADLLGHWSKRNATAIRDLDPDRLDVDALMGYMARYGDDAVTGRLDEIAGFFRRPASRPGELDEFARAEIRSPEDVRDLFVPNFYFGCEADDPLVGWAFAEDVNPLGARLKAMIGSDISHWDVPDMTEPIEEAWEMVEHGRITPRDFRDFTFENPARLHAGMNPHFFEGTVVEAAVRNFLNPSSR